MRLLAETNSLEMDALGHKGDTARPESSAQLEESPFSPIVDRVFAGAGAGRSETAAPFSVGPLRTPVLQRAQRLYGNRASQRIVMRSRGNQGQPSGDAAFDGLPGSPGHPLDSATRQPLEAHFGADLADVRVHTGSEASQSADSLDALAYTSGRDIYFASGMYSPASGAGQRLLAHEVAHVVQQGAGKQPAIATQSRAVRIGAAGDALESDADQEAEKFMSRPGSPQNPADDGSAQPRAMRQVRSSAAPNTIQRFASREHEELGNTTGVSIDLGNGVILSWGQVLALAGDYYETPQKLLDDTKTPDGQGRIRAAMEKGGLPSVAASTLPVPSGKNKDDMTMQYLGLAVGNVPHFLLGGTSRQTWLGYHAEAIDDAVKEGLAGSALNDAYFTEAFGEHFYTDSFSGGHIRTPRDEISNWYGTVFGPRVVDHFINTLRGRAEQEIYDQVVGTAAQILLPDDALLAIWALIHREVGRRLEAAIASIGGRAKMAEMFGRVVGGMVSGAIHDREGEQGVLVNSPAHPSPWMAYGDGHLDDPKNADSKSEATGGIKEAKADLDEAYVIGESERVDKSKIPAPSALPSAIYFGFDHWDLSSVAATLLDGARSYMLYTPQTVVSLVGHTDPIGDTGYNLDLGAKRARTVAAEFENGGIDPARVAESSEGEAGMAATRPRDYWRDRRVNLVWSSSTGLASHDVAYERSMAKVKTQIGPPYLAENRFPTPVAGMNREIPEWHWGKLDPGFQKEIADWVTGMVKPSVASIVASSQLDPIDVYDAPVYGAIIIEPRPIVQGIVNDLLADPIDFLNKGFGESAGP